MPTCKCRYDYKAKCRHINVEGTRTIPISGADIGDNCNSRGLKKTAKNWLKNELTREYSKGGVTRKCKIKRLDAETSSCSLL